MELRAEEDAVVAAFMLAAEWIKEKLGEEFFVDIFNDFGIVITGRTDLEDLFKACLAGKLSLETFLRELKRRGVISEGIDIDEEIERIKQQGPELSEGFEDDGDNGVREPDGQ